MSKIDDLDIALTAAADVLEMDLDMQHNFPHSVYGEAVRTLNWFGADMKLLPTVIESKVDGPRGIVLLVAHLMGSLYCCLLSDFQEAKLTMFLLDGPKIGCTPTKSELLPKFWLRESLYAKLAPGLKATYNKTFNDAEWVMKAERGWMDKYLADKAESRAATSK